LRDDRDDSLSRRELLKRAGAAGVVAFIPVAAIAAPSGVAGQVAAPAAREPVGVLTAAEAVTLAAMCARLIPTDANGPGAAEAQAARYIDRALGGALSGSRAAYASGLAAVDGWAASSRGARFAALSAADQDRVLEDVAADAATGFPSGSAAFFNLVRAHTIEGTFCDPYYGGNAGFVGWDLIGYPGARTIVTAAEQQLGADTKPNHKSAYDYEMFNKA